MDPQKRGQIFEAFAELFGGASSMSRGVPKAIRMLRDPSFRREAVELGAEALGRVGKKHFEKFLQDLLERMRRKRDTDDDKNKQESH